MTSTEDGVWRNRLKAKEKILVQLYIHMSEKDAGAFPFEVTQKGLSEHLGLRRSHVTIALQELAKDDLVEVCKGHIEGEQRRQNAYCITPKGIDHAADIRSRLLSMEVQFETTDGVKTVEVAHILSSGSVTLASIICQMDRGGLVRDEITVMTKPEKKLISVFCPTCKKQIEVDNFYIDEEVGFDCPGCGRPYRIIPALRAGGQTQIPTSARRQSISPLMANLLSIILLSSLFIFAFVYENIVFAFVGAIALITWLAISMKNKPALRPRTPLKSVTLILMTSPILLLFWYLLVTHIDFNKELKLALLISAGLAAGYALTRFKFPDFKGDFMVIAGSALILIAASTLFVVDFGAIGVGTAPFLGIIGALLFALSTFQVLDRDALILDSGVGTGVFILLLTYIVVLPACSEVIDYLAAGATILLGLFLIILRVVREMTGSKDMSAHLLASLPFPGAAIMLTFGIALMDAGSEFAGVVELIIMIPLVYYGYREVFNKDWIYRVPISVLIIGFVVLVLTAGIIV